MEPRTFFIPTQVRFWRRSVHRDPEAFTKEELAWAEIEAKRAQVLMGRIFPDVSFELCNAPPETQTYEAGSRNAEIRDVLGARTGLHLPA